MNKHILNYLNLFLVKFHKKFEVNCMHFLRRRTNSVKQRKIFGYIICLLAIRISFCLFEEKRRSKLNHNWKERKFHLPGW